MKLIEAGKGNVVYIHYGGFKICQVKVLIQAGKRTFCKILRIFENAIKDLYEKYPKHKGELNFLWEKESCWLDSQFEIQNIYEFDELQLN